MSKQGRLMIGDLIKIWGYPQEGNRDLQTARITGIMTKVFDDEIDFMEGIVLSTNKIFTRPLEDYEPIPITKEILAANGWKTPRLFDTFSSQIELYDSSVCITLDNIHHDLHIRIDEAGYNFPKPKYVHELQDSLRVCGLDDIADNFKIE